MTYFEAFDKVKKVFESAKTDKLTKDFAIQVNLTDEDCCGAFYIEYKDGALNVEPYDYIDNNAMVTTTLDVLLKALASKVSLNRSVASGKIEIVGDSEVFGAIPSIIAKPKAAAKKASAKKAEPKAVKAEATKKVETKKAGAKGRMASEKPAAKKTEAKKPAAKKTTKK